MCFGQLHSTSSFRRQIEKPRRRDVIDPQTVRVQLLQQREIPLDLRTIGELITLRVGLERPIRHAFRVELLRTQPEELAVSQHPLHGRQRAGARRRGGTRGRTIHLDEIELWVWHGLDLLQNDVLAGAVQWVYNRKHLRRQLGLNQTLR